MINLDMTVHKGFGGQVQWLSDFGGFSGFGGGGFEDIFSSFFGGGEQRDPKYTAKVM